MAQPPPPKRVRTGRARIETEVNLDDGGTPIIQTTFSKKNMQWTYASQQSPLQAFCQCVSTVIVHTATRPATKNEMRQNINKLIVVGSKDSPGIWLRFGHQKEAGKKNNCYQPHRFSYSVSEESILVHSVREKLDIPFASIKFEPTALPVLSENDQKSADKLKTRLLEAFDRHFAAAAEHTEDITFDIDGIDDDDERGVCEVEMSNIDEGADLFAADARVLVGIVSATCQAFDIMHSAQLSLEDHAELEWTLFGQKSTMGFIRSEPGMSSDNDLEL